MKLAKSSPVIELLNLVWNNCQAATAHSYERINHSMHSTLMLAIGSGFAFQDDDFEYIGTHYNSNRWLGADHECYYTRAVVEGNLSAAKSYELWKGREPFIADDVDLPRWMDKLAHSAGPRAKERIHVGAEFIWKTERVKVTSFSADGQSVTACLYEHDYVNGGHHAKIKRRFTITREGIKLDRAERKERKKLAEEMQKLAGNFEWNLKLAMVELGVETQKEFDLLPVDKIKKQIEKMRKSPCDKEQIA